MKKSGIIILLIGLLSTLITTVALLVHQQVTEGSTIEVAPIQINNLIWESMIGAILIMTGVVMVKFGKKGEMKMA